ncbi:MAG: sulfatase-like hydrolase/transferase [Candidatus Aminicenantes bacterium]|nr:sulfatase-like hydrolase/transferase [Candidatus Aminicenantes bacterium]
MRKNIITVLFSVLVLLRFGLVIIPDAALKSLIGRNPAAGYKGPGWNVVLISIDTLRADHVKSYGYERKTSPRIDDIAKNAWVFRNAVSQSSWTLPAHASMFTGLLPSELGLVFYDNEGLEKNGRIGKMDTRLLTLAKVLRSYGYMTIGFHGGAWVNPIFGLNAGFDIYRWGGRYFEENVDAAVQWLEKNGGKKFFLFLHGYDVHMPYNADKKFNIFFKYGGNYELEKIKPGQIPAEPGSPEHDYIVSQYDAGIRRADFHLGRFFDWLDDKGLTDKTLLIITSDHGEMLNLRHKNWGHIYPLYEELIHVPLIIKVPGESRADVTLQVPAMTSLLPTLLDILEISHSKVDYRQSLVPLVRGKNRKFDHIFSETGKVLGNRFCRCVRTEKWKLHFYREDGKGTWFELYNLVSDPMEQKNLAGIYPEIVRELKNPLLDFTLAEIVRTGRKTLDKKTMEELKSLGYIR